MKVRSRILTNASDRHEAGSVFRRRAIRKYRLQGVNAEGEGDNGLTAGPHDHALHPKPDERHEWPEGLHDVGIIGP